MQTTRECKLSQEKRSNGIRSKQDRKEEKKELKKFTY
jgi:hypothetical protein